MLAAAALLAGGGCNEQPAHRTAPPPLTTVARIRDAERYARAQQVHEQERTNGGG